MKVFHSEQLKGDSGSGDFALGSSVGVPMCVTHCPVGCWQKVVADLQMCVTWEAQNLEALVAQSLSHVPLSVTPRTVARQAPLSMDSPGKHTGVGCHALLQGIFPTRDRTCISCTGWRLVYH